MQDQSTLLEETWSQLFLLNASYWPIDLGVLVLRIYTGRSSQELTVSTSVSYIAKSMSFIFDPVADVLDSSLFLWNPLVL